MGDSGGVVVLVLPDALVLGLPQVAVLEVEDVEDVEVLVPRSARCASEEARRSGRFIGVCRPTRKKVGL